MPAKPGQAANVLAALLKTEPEQAHSLNIKQILALCGTGKLADANACSIELREFLLGAPSESLFVYSETCLKAGFDDSGLVLQDVVNELGRRLDYQVENGLYRGKSNAVGHDGIWRSPAGHDLVVEVKTTDTYRMNLDTVASYKEELTSSARLSKESSILLVVGRQDTGDLEAQVRGSKHAWSIRIISVDSLTRLVALKESTEDETTKRIHDLLIPFEYTRLDKIIDIAFTAARDATAASDTEEPLEVESAEVDQKSHKQVHTSKKVVEELREEVLKRLSRREGVPLLKKTRALYWSPDRKVRVACTFSKRFERGNYWYAYHPAWDSFLAEGERSFFVLGCVDRSEAFAIPRKWMSKQLNLLHQTNMGEKSYWHIHVEPSGPQSELHLKLHKAKTSTSLKEFEL